MNFIWKIDKNSYNFEMNLKILIAIYATSEKILENFYASWKFIKSRI